LQASAQWRWPTRKLYSTARGQAHELHQLLELSSELSSIGKLDKFLEAFVVRAADFLGFGRCFIGLLEDGFSACAFGAEKGAAQHVECDIPRMGLRRKCWRRRRFSGPITALQFRCESGGN
jgi:hypothetical protein